MMRVVAGVGQLVRSGDANVLQPSASTYSLLSHTSVTKISRLWGPCLCNTCNWVLSLTTGGFLFLTYFIEPPPCKFGTVLSLKK